MKKNILLFLLLICSTSIVAQNKVNNKEIYIPKDLQSIDLNNPDSKWSYERMVTSPNFVVFWEKGFGLNLSNAPKLDGHTMNVDLGNLIGKLEAFYKFYRETLLFTKGESKCDKYRMMVMINYSLEGTAYGGDYDGVIGALWVTPNRLQDKKLNCIAHELGHSFQSQISCDNQGEAWGGAGFFEMTSQWMLWQVNPDWITDEKYHWDAFKTLTHKAYLSLENIYHSPYILEYWSQKRGLPVIAQLFREGKKGDDPVITYKKMFNLSQKQFCDEMFDASSHIVNMDYKRVWENTRAYSNQLQSHLDKSEKNWYVISKNNAPEEYGFNAIALSIPEKSGKVEVDFCGLPSDTPKMDGWRYGFVAVNGNGQTIYGTMNDKTKGKAQFVVKESDKITHLWFVVMAAPQEHSILSFDGKAKQWLYKLKIKGSTIL